MIGCAAQAPADGSGAGPAATATSVNSAVDTKALAAKLVANAAVKEGDAVLVMGGVPDWALLEDLAVEVRKTGAFPLVSTSSEQLVHRMYDEVPARFDSQRPTLDLRLAEAVDVVINVGFGEQQDLLASVPPERTAARAAAAEPASTAALRKNQRSLSLGNGLLPTASLAALYDVPQETLASTYWAGINTDYAQLQAAAKSVGAKLEAGRRVRITHPNGTDLTVDIAGRRVIGSDGVISADDMKKGGADVLVYLPAGEVFLAPVPGSANGKVVISHGFYLGAAIEMLELSFANGRLTGMTAASGLAPLKAAYDAAGAGKDEFAFVDVGINRDVQIAAGSLMLPWMAEGMVTVGIGNNSWAGGTNNGGFGYPLFMPGSTLEIDGAPLVKDGKLVQ
jgi:leucyl aminopeptidase (aminopeptidase T)